MHGRISINISFELSSFDVFKDAQGRVNVELGLQSPPSPSFGKSATLSSSYRRSRPEAVRVPKKGGVDVKIGKQTITITYEKPASKTAAALSRFRSRAKTFIAFLLGGALSATVYEDESVCIVVYGFSGNRKSTSVLPKSKRRVKLGCADISVSLDDNLFLKTTFNDI